LIFCFFRRTPDQRGSAQISGFAVRLRLLLAAAFPRRSRFVLGLSPGEQDPDLGMEFLDFLSEQGVIGFLAEEPRKF
jgi:hypothetical protein